MKKRGGCLHWKVVFGLIALGLIGPLPSCKKGPPTKAAAEQASQAVDLDVQKISSQLGFTFKIFKTATHGSTSKYKYYWISLPEKADQPRIESLAKAVIDETIAKYPETYHCFMIHFFFEADRIGGPEISKPFAQVSYLPEGDWFKIGRSPIDGYKAYRLITIFLGK
jgi:hypothetical protein